MSIGGLSITDMAQICGVVLTGIGIANTVLSHRASKNSKDSRTENTKLHDVVKKSMDDSRARELNFMLEIVKWMNNVDDRKGKHTDGQAPVRERKSDAYQEGTDGY